MLGDHRIDEGACLRRVPQITAMNACAAPGCSGDHGGWLTSADRYFATGCKQGFGNSPSEAARSAGDDRDFA